MEFTSPTTGHKGAHMQTSTIVEPVFTTKCGGAVLSPNFGGELRVAQRRFPIGTTDREAIEGLVAAEYVVLTSDGRHLSDGWHRADVDGLEGEAGYFEIHTRGGNVVHGWLDVASRRVVQIG